MKILKESEMPRPKKGHKCLIRHNLTWRSREFQDILESLDREIARRSLAIKVQHTLGYLANVK